MAFRSRLEAGISPLSIASMYSSIYSLHLLVVIRISLEICSPQSQLTQDLQHLSIDFDQFTNAIILLVAPLIGYVLILRSHSALFDIPNQSIFGIPQGHIVLDEVKKMLAVHPLTLQLVRQVLLDLLSNLTL